MRHRFASLTFALLLGGCALLPPRGSDDPGPARLQTLATGSLDLSAPVEVRWNDHGVPFITADSDADGAFALGFVHAHLRLGQMAVAREIVAGRISAMAGPWTTDLDAALRGFDFGRASAEIHAAMPDHSRAWLDRFVAGVNAYAERLDRRALPHEFQVAGLDWRPWTAEDTITLGRAGGIDINWGTYIRMLGIDDPDVRARVFARLAQAGKSGAVTFDGPASDRAALDGFARLAALGRAAGKSGSNSVVVAPRRSASGAAMIANDPHLGFFMPNVWLIAGLRTPSYQGVGMMVPGTPVFGFGRTPHLAWGGTNLRATTSELVDISTLPAEEIMPVTHDIAVRGWFSEKRRTADTPYGPVLTGTAPFLDTATPFAVRWVGHQPTDEITALLGAMTARTVDQFREAMRPFALPAQTFLVATREGDIGAVIATTVPARSTDDPLRVIATPAQSDRTWRRVVSAPDLPMVVNPGTGTLASANNRPAPDREIAFGGIFPQDERMRRLEALLDSRATWSLADLGALQMDTVSMLARDTLQRAGPPLGAWAPTGPAEARAIALLTGWDGDYAVDSAAAPVYEAFIEAAIDALYAHLGTPEARAWYGDSYIRRFAYEDMADLDDAGWAAVLGAAVPAAGQMAARNLVWGDLHRIAVGHLFRRIPVIGGRYREGEFPIQGAQTTVFKTAHTTSLDPHTANFGAQSRHLSDMSDPDENYFVLFGGQDGWIGARNFSDQVPLWRQGQAIRVPLSPEGVAAAFTHVTRLTP